LHGILHGSAYPQWDDSLERFWPAPTHAANRLVHCVQHIVINTRLAALGYDIPAEKGEGAGTRLRFLEQFRQSVQDERFKVVEVAAYMGELIVEPQPAEDVVAEFQQETFRLFRDARRLTDRIVTEARTLDVDSPRDTHRCLRRMLKVTEQQYGHDPEYRDLRKKVRLPPLHVSRQRLSMPAAKWVYVLSASVKKSKNKHLVTVYRPWGTAIAVSKPIPPKDFKRSERDLRDRLSRPLRDILGHMKVEVRPYD